MRSPRNRPGLGLRAGLGTAIGAERAPALPSHPVPHSREHSQLGMLSKMREGHSHSLSPANSRIGRSAVACGESDRMRNLALLAYAALGVLVSSQHDYYAHLTTVSQVFSAVVATDSGR